MVMVFEQEDFIYDLFNLVEQSYEDDRVILEMAVVNDYIQLTESAEVYSESVKESIEAIYNKIVEIIHRIINTIKAAVKSFIEKIVPYLRKNKEYAISEEKRFLEADLSKLEITDWKEWDMNKYPTEKVLFPGIHFDLYEEFRKPLKDIKEGIIEGKGLLSEDVLYKFFATQADSDKTILTTDKFSVEDMRKEFHEAYCTEDAKLVGLNDKDKKQTIDILSKSYFDENRYKSFEQTINGIMNVNITRCQKIKNIKEDDDDKNTRLNFASKYITMLQRVTSNCINCIMHEDLAIMNNSRRVLALSLAYIKAEKIEQKG